MPDAQPPPRLLRDYFDRARLPVGGGGRYAAAMSKSRLWAPWRLDYLQASTEPPPADRGCFLCDAGQSPPDPPPTDAKSAEVVTQNDGQNSADTVSDDTRDGGSQSEGPAEHDAQRLVLHRTARATLLLNRYPYSNGHLLVAPRQHVADLSDLEAVDRAELMELCELGGRLLRQVAHPQGLNVGANLGRAAGAGVPGHLHLHVVPRWAGDCNFMTVVADARVIPQALQASYRQLRAALPDLL